MKKEDIKGTKIFIENFNKLEEVKDKLFFLGVKWNSIERKPLSNYDTIISKNSVFAFYIDNNLKLKYDFARHDDYTFYKSFIKDNRKEIHLNEILKIKEQK